MLYAFGCWNVATPLEAMHSERLFQTGWFVESVLTQTLVTHLIRTNKVPFLQSRPSALLAFTTVAIISIGISLPFTALGEYLGFTALPAAYWAYVAPTVVCYLLLTQALKTWFVRRGGFEGGRPSPRCAAFVEHALQRRGVQ